MAAANLRGSLASVPSDQSVLTGKVTKVIPVFPMLSDIERMILSIQSQARESRDVQVERQRAEREAGMRGQG